MGTLEAAPQTDQFQGSIARSNYYDGKMLRQAGTFLLAAGTVLTAGAMGVDHLIGRDNYSNFEHGLAATTLGIPAIMAVVGGIRERLFRHAR